MLDNSISAATRIDTLHVNVTENIRVERNWWVLLKYGVGLSLLGIVPTVIVFWLWIL